MAAGVREASQVPQLLLPQLVPEVVFGVRLWLWVGEASQVPQTASGPQGSTVREGCSWGKISMPAYFQIQRKTAEKAHFLKAVNIANTFSPDQISE